MTSPSKIDPLKRYVQRSLIDNQGKLLPDGWGLAEMRIMAALLRGERNFARTDNELDLVTVKQKDGVDRIVYQFHLMKCQQIAIVKDRDIGTGSAALDRHPGIRYPGETPGPSDH